MRSVGRDPARAHSGITLEAVAKRPHTNDLFELFPDLPWTRPGATDDRARILRQVDEARARADNIQRQKATSGRVREILSARRRR